jgi:integrase
MREADANCRSFLTRFSIREKEALAFREDAGARLVNAPTDREIRTVAQGIQKWLDICEKEGRNGREPVTRYTLDNYEYRAAIANKYTWSKELNELTKPDIIEFRSWILENYSRDVAHKVLTSFNSMILAAIPR